MDEIIERERWVLLERLVRAFETPVVRLGLVWLVLLVLELTGAASHWLERLGNGIWAIFVIDFLARLLVAPRRVVFPKRY